MRNVLPRIRPLAVLATAALAVAPLAAQLEHAPPAREVDGLTAQPIDILRMDGKIVFDVEQKEARATAEFTFRTGAAGTPVFDLRQPIAKAWLDGEEISPDKLKPRDFGEATGTMRILEVEMEAGSEHQMRLEYVLQTPASPQAQEIKWGNTGVHWDTYFSDLNQGRYMEMWFPANLLFDQHPVTMELQVLGATQKHHMVTNATIEVLGEFHWKLSFPASYSAFSHMVVLIPDSLVERSVSEVEIDGRTIRIDVCKLKRASTALEDIHAQTAQALRDFSASMGPWAHGNRCDVFVWTGGRSMEYDGATTTSMGALRHEIFHSWFGRGAKPANQNGGWWDEAWTVYYGDDGHKQMDSAMLRAEREPLTLATADPWNRVTPRASYRGGAMHFGRVAEVMGKEELIAAMAAFFQQHAPNVCTTEQMVEHLAAAAGENGDKVRALFDRYVYGKDVPHPAFE